MGAHNRSAIATLVDRCTRQVMLVHLPSKSAQVVTAALAATIGLFDFPRGGAWSCC
jgi:IS30 family transposase